MEGQDTILNELLEQIKTLEKSNESLKKEITKKKETILKLDSQNIELKLDKGKEKGNKKILETKKIPTEEEDNIEARKACQYYKNMKANREIQDNCVEYTINYLSYEHHTNLYIMGDFNKWEMTKMEKNGENFVFRIILLKGFKYYFVFQSDEQIIIDYNNDYEENPKNLQIQNYINLNQKNENNLFDSDNDMNILKLAQKNYFLSKIDINDDEFFFLAKFRHHGMINKEINMNKLKKHNELLNSINIYYDECYKYLNHYNDHINRVVKLKQYLKNKILMHYSKDETKKIYNLYYYKIVNLNVNSVFECIKLYDNNNIKINAESYSSPGFYYTVLPTLISTKPITKESKLYHLMSNEESKKILDNYEKDDKGILKIYFKTLNNLKNNANINNENNEGDIAQNSYKRQNMIFVTPYKIEPENINKDDYDFYYTTNKIKKVRNKKEGSSVMFKVIDESELKKNKPIRYEIYYAVKDNKIQIIHCHVKDKDLLNIKIVIKEIDKNTDPHVLKREQEYIINNNLLLLIQDLNPFKLYFQGKKVKMLAIKIEENKLYLLQSSNSDSIFNKMYVKVKNIFEKIKFDLMEKCDELIYDINNIENIQNSVDIEVNFDPDKNYVTEKMMLSVSPCLLKPISSYDENLLKKQMYKNVLNDGQIRENMTDMERYFDIGQKMVEYRKYDKNKIKDMTFEEKDKLNFILNEYSKEMNGIMIYIQDNEMWDIIDEAMIIKSEITNLINLLNEK